eukprot:5257597-Ditylum_brightwellii.AAC.1
MEITEAQLQNFNIKEDYHHLGGYMSSDALTEAYVNKKVDEQDLLDLASLSVNKGELGSLNPCQESALNCATSLDSTSNLMEAIFGKDKFKTDVHANTMESGKLGGKQG